MSRVLNQHEKKIGNARVDDFRKFGKRVFKEKYDSFTLPLLNEAVNFAFIVYGMKPVCSSATPFSFNTIHGMLVDRFSAKKTIQRPVGRPFTLYKNWEEEAPELFAELSKLFKDMDKSYMKQALTKIWDLMKHTGGWAFL